MLKILFHGSWRDDKAWYENYIKPYYDKFPSTKFIPVSCKEEADRFVFGNQVPVWADKSKSLIYQYEPWPTRNQWMQEHTDNYEGIRWPYFIKQHHVPVHPYLNTINDSFKYADPSIIKYPRIVAVLSRNNSFEGHRPRFDFVASLVQQFQIPMDFFGTITGVWLENKPAKMAEYQYALCVENYSEPGYFTEKFWDAILAETIPFYWGCPNLKRLGIPDECYVQVYRNDPARSAQIIKETLANNTWEKRIDIIREVKKMLLNKMSLFAVVEREMSL